MEGTELYKFNQHNMFKFATVLVLALALVLVTIFGNPQMIGNMYQELAGGIILTIVVALSWF